MLGEKQQHQSAHPLKLPHRHHLQCTVHRRLRSLHLRRPGPALRSCCSRLLRSKCRTACELASPTHAAPLAWTAAVDAACTIATIGGPATLSEPNQLFLRAIGLGRSGCSYVSLAGAWCGNCSAATASAASPATSLQRPAGPRCACAPGRDLPTAPVRHQDGSSRIKHVISPELPRSEA